MQKKPKIKIDLSDWELGLWPDMLRDALLDGLSVRKNFNGFEIELDLDGFNPIARKIAQEAIEEFVNGDDTVAVLTTEGVVLEGLYEDEKQRFLIAWAEPWARSADELDRFEEWIRQMRKDME
jgi:hypothetical protein